MFYKKLEHYENTLKKILREEFDFEIDFESDWGYCFLSAMYESSDRMSRDCVGYDFLCYVKSSCRNSRDVVGLINLCKEKSCIITEYTVEGMNYIKSTMKESLCEIGYVVERVVI